MDLEKYPNFIKDLGMRFSKKSSKNKARYWLVRCRECDNRYETLKQSAIKSNFLCYSCSKRIQKTIHGDHKARLYRIYNVMIQRCYNKKHSKYSYYGGRGIKICNEWLTSYIIFRHWALSNGYHKELSIDRENNDGNYEPSNCRWVVDEIQHRNTKRIMKTNTSGYRGVTFHKHSKKWQSKIMVDSKNHSLGYHKCRFSAAYAYDSYVKDNNLQHTINFK